MENKEIFDRASKLSAATLHEAAGKRGALPSGIKPITPAFTICGPALPVLSPQKDNLWLHRAIYEAKPGDILVVDVGGYYEAGYFGEIMSQAAMERKIGGLIIDGCVRDGHLIVEMGFPSFSRGLCIQGTGKDHNAYGHVNKPVRIENVFISPGDLVFGDQDGIVVIPKDQMEEAVHASEIREEKEKEILARLRSGETTLDIYQFDKVRVSR